MLNINAGHNDAVLKQYRDLNEYSLFVETTRSFPELPREEGFKKAIGECIEKDILRAYLIKNSSEVYNMLTVEWNLHDAVAVSLKEGIEIGMEKGRAEERGEAVQNLLNYGMKPDDISRALNMPLDAVLNCRAAPR